MSLAELESIPEVGPVVAASIHEFFQDPENQKLLDDLPGRRRAPRAAAAGRRPAAASCPSPGKTFVLTGTLPKRTRAEAEALDQAARRQGHRLGVEVDQLRPGRRGGRQQARQGQAARHPGHRRGRVRTDGGDFLSGEGTLFRQGKQRGIRLRTLLIAVAVCAIICALAVQVYRSLSPVRRSARQLQAANSAFTRLSAVSTLADPKFLPPWEREEAYRILLGAIDDPDAFVRSSAAMALMRRRDHVAQVVSLLIGLTKDKDPRVRLTALFALEQFPVRVSPEADAITEVAVAALNDPKPAVRLEAGPCALRLRPGAAICSRDGPAGS